jgi:hypothetical protein
LTGRRGRACGVRGAARKGVTHPHIPGTILDHLWFSKGFKFICPFFKMTIIFGGTHGMDVFSYARNLYSSPI